MRTSRWSVRTVVLALLGAALLLAVWPTGRAQAHGLTSTSVAHALPVRYVPAQNAALQTPPPQVQITFSEHVNPDISKIVVVNPSNQQVDNRDSQVSDDALTMTVSLPLLPAGTYIVFWRTHSADDGHVAAGRYLFYIKRADGTVPPLSGPLPSGNIIGGAGIATFSSLDGPNLLGALARWVALLALTFLLGLLFWAYVVQPRQPQLEDWFRTDFSPRMRREIQIALGVILGATLAEIVAQAWLLNGSLQGVTSPLLLRSIVLQSRFGRAILVRGILALLGLVVLALRRHPLADVWLQRFTVAMFGFGLAIAFEYSGHGGAAPQWYGPIVDFLHLLANSVWLGGLFVLALVIVPLLRRRDRADREAYLARSIPAFSVPALTAVAFVTVTGPLNATVRMTSVQQLWTTPYGVVLVIKSALFLCMVAISYQHAFRLRPGLATALGVADASATAWYHDIPVVGTLLSRALPLSQVPMDGSGGGGIVAVAPTGSAVAVSPSGGEHTGDQIMWWMRIEAAVGVGVLLCAALLAPLAGTLTPSLASSNAGFGAQGGNQTLTQKVDGLTMTLSVDPGKFGTNTFTLTVTNPDGFPASNGTAFLESTMVEMDMGTNEIDLAPTGAPGTYSGQGQLEMAGHWHLEAVIRTKQDPGHLHRTTFTISASY
jgi:copper transport protein